MDLYYQKRLTFRKIKRFSITVGLLLIIFWSLLYTSTCASDIYCNMGKLGQINTVLASKFILRAVNI